MWAKDSPESLITSREPAPPVAARHNPEDRPEGPSVIGPEIVIDGEVGGTQDVLVMGRIKGRLSLPGHRVTVGRRGRVEAEILAQVIRIDGFLEGTVQGETKILLHATARVRGKLIAPTVVMQEGCRFRGSVDMVENTKASEA